ncbi:hypothetical protein GQ457_07G012960 [Hibiscus cannabinus]
MRLQGGNPSAGTEWGEVGQEGGKGGRPPDGAASDQDAAMTDSLAAKVQSGILFNDFTGNGEEAIGNEGGRGVNGNVNSVLSFKETLLSNSTKNRVSNPIDELDVELVESDVQIGGASELPEIWFSDRVHDAIDAKLAKSMIIRLLGKTIGYRALWNRIMALWCPVGAISLVDLDNDYYLVRFANEEDFHKVLSGGPWVIYGSYLTVQPWTRYFNAAEDHPSHIMVWARLPKLPYRYYTKSLFQHIAATIGKVVKIDYNTEAGKRGRFARLALIVDLSKLLISGIVIDGRRQDIEYEGLPTICYKCGKYGHAKEVCGTSESSTVQEVNPSALRNPTKLYGPWMQVVNKRRRNVSLQRSNRIDNGSSRETVALGSRFATLAEVVNEGVAVEEDLGIVVSTRKEQVGGTGRLSTFPAKGGVDVHQQQESQPVRNQVIEHETRFGKGVDDRVDREVETESREERFGAVLWVASQEPVIRETSSLNKAKPVVVRVGGEEEPRLGVKGGSKLTSKPPRSVDRVAAKSGTIGRLSILASDLDKAANEERLKVQQSSDTGVTKGVGVAWQTNSVYEQPDPGFKRSFKLLMRKQKPDIVVIMEPRISGSEADKFIHRSRFEFSYRVEARGFSGGIWLLWRDTISVQVLAVSNQYIHALCSLGGGGGSFFGTFVYASPDALRRRSLWEHLITLDPGIDNPWVVGGDLNVIRSASERFGGSNRRSGICSYFNDFLLNSGLIDMGFSGPRFTWRRGNLFQRLDRCLCNSAWLQAFPWSAVYHLLKLGSDHRPIMLRLVEDGATCGNRPFRYLSAWNDHSDFPLFLKSVWVVEKSFHENVVNFQNKVRSWNREVFGFIDRRKSRPMARIRGIERALESSFRPSLVRLEEDLKEELDVVLSQEESIWQQKSRSNWINKGDRNTSYFHMAASTRRKRNMVRMLRIANGDWCEDPSTLRHHAVNFFRHLFTTDFVQPRVMDSSANFRQFTADELKPLVSAVTMEEVRGVVFSMAPLKAPGYDGLHVAFYQKNWETVGLSVFQVVKDFLDNGVLGDETTSFSPGMDFRYSAVDNGGLGFKDLHVQNQTFLMKIGFLLVSDDDRLWVCVLKSKYHWEGVMPLSIRRNGCSRLWTGLCNIWDDLKECIHWEIWDGRDTNFWYDHWLGREDRLALSCLSSEAPRPVCVADMVSVHGNWDWERLEAVLPREKLELIAAVQPPRSDAGLDRPGWRWEEKRNFSVSSAYGYLFHGLDFGNGDTWKRVWKIAVPQRVRMFIWLTFHNRLLTNVERVRRHVATSESCEICNNGQEDIDHVLRSCTVAKGVWTRLLPPARCESFFGLPFPEWLHLNLFDRSFYIADDEWGVRFAITCWLLWKRRCRLLFEPGEGMMEDVLRRGGRLVEECSRAPSVNTGAPAGRLRTSTWSKPRVGWVKLNVEASVSTIDRSAGVGGVFRDNQGKWLFGFTRFVGRCETLLAELWAIHDGLLHAWELGYRCVEVESDCLDAVKIAMARSKTLDRSALVCSIHRLLSNDWCVVVTHVDRGCNGVADALARRGRGSSMAPVSLFEAPDEVACMVESEREVPFNGRGSSLTSTALEEREVPFDPGGFN